MSFDAGCGRSDDDWWRYPTLAGGHVGAVRPNVPKATCFPVKNAAGVVVVTVFLVMTVILVLAGTGPAEAIGILVVAGSAAVTLAYRLSGRRVGGGDDAALPA